MGWKFYLMHWEWQFYMNFKAMLKIYKLLEKFIPCRPKCSTTKSASHMIFLFNRTNLPHLIRIQLWIFFRELKLECPIWFLHSNNFYQSPFLHVFPNSGVICNLSFVFTFGKAIRQWSRESWLSRSLWMMLGQELRQKQLPLKYILLSNLPP